VILRSSSVCFKDEIERKISESFDPRETPNMLALAAVSWSENLEKERLHFVPGVMAW
jgi:hypothetical protein